MVVDTEYGATTWNNDLNKHKISKVDMLAISTQSDNTYNILLIELKDKNDTVNNNCGIADHVRDFKDLLTNKTDDIVESVKNILKIKTNLGLIKNPSHNLTFSGKIECMLLFCGIREAAIEAQREKVRRYSSGLALYTGQADLNGNILFESIKAFK